MRLPLLVSASLWATLLSSPCSAQTPPRNQFFEKDFAANPLSETRPQAMPSREPLLDQRSKPTATPAVTLHREAKQRDQLGFEIAHTLAVKSVGAIIDLTNPEVGTEVLGNFLELERQFRWPLGKFYLIALPAMLHSYGLALTELQGYGATVKLPFSVPKKYANVTLSPTWLIQTVAGEYVVEAPDDLARYFNSKGEFLDPKSSEWKENEEDGNQTSRETASPSPTPSATPSDDQLEH